MRDATQPSWRRWIKIGALGCAGAIAVAAIALGTLVAITYRGYEEAFKRVAFYARQDRADVGELFGRIGEAARRPLGR